MKKIIRVLFFIFLPLVFLLSGCEKSNGNGFEFDGATLESGIYKISVSNDTDKYSFKDKIIVNENYSWYMSKDEKGENVFDSDTLLLELGDNIFYIHVNDEKHTDTYIICIRRKPLYRVKFNLLNGTTIDEQYIEEEGKATQPNDPIKKGYDFTGWDFDFNTPIMQDVVINAEYKITNYSIVYNLNGGSFISNSNINESYTIESNYFNLPEPVKQNFIFKGWYDNAEYIGSKVTSVKNGSTGNMTLFAKYEINTEIELLINDATMFVEVLSDTQSWNSVIKLTNNIDLKNISLAPIGNSKRAFTGVFIGNGCTISNFNCSADKHYAGLFGYINNATIRNLNIYNFALTYSYVNNSYNGCFGLLVGYANNSNIENCSVNGNINIYDSAGVSIGGVCGSTNGRLTSCSSNITMIATGRASSIGYSIITGGLVGRSDADSIIEYCNVSGKIETYHKDNIESGGLVGLNWGNISKSWANIDIYASSKSDINLGGLVGSNKAFVDTTLDNCYTLGNITIDNTQGNNSYVGGIVGYNRIPIINSCYSDVDIELIGINCDSASGDIYVVAGGIVGKIESGLITNCYSLGKIEATSTYKDTHVIVGSIYAITQVENANNLEYNQQELIAIKGSENGQTITGNNKMSLSEIWQLISTTWDSNIWSLYLDKNPILK